MHKQLNENERHARLQEVRSQNCQFYAILMFGERETDQRTAITIGMQGR